jgi:Holliday junction resolvase RusA-like endonuclease
MSSTVSFFCQGEPATKGSMRAYTYRRKSGRIGARVAHDNDRTAAWSQALGWAARQALRGASFDAAAVEVRCSFVVPRPRDHYGTGRNAGQIKPGAPREPTSHATGDVDKLVRCLLDALTGIAWADDSQVVEVRASKAYHDPLLQLRAVTGCHVEIRERF